MEFSIKWAAAAPAYVGMLAGTLRMLAPAFQGRTGSLPEIGQAIMIGLFFGGTMGLPLVASNLVAALLTTWIARGQTFLIQFGCFVALSALGYWIMLNWLAKVFGTMGGRSFVTDGLWLQAGFVLASAGLALVLMRWHPG